MKTVKLILGIVTIGMIVASCNKEVQEPEVKPTNSSTPGTNSSTPTGTSTISYTDLSAEQSTIAIGATALRATASRGGCLRRDLLLSRKSSGQRQQRQGEHRRDKRKTFHN